MVYMSLKNRFFPNGIALVGVRALCLSARTAVLLGLASSPALAGSFQGLGDLPGGTFRSYANAVSDDGSTVVGYSSSASSSASGWEAFRWTSGGGMVGLGDLPGGTFQSYAHGVSDDLWTIVGSSSSASGD